MYIRQVLGSILFGGAAGIVSLAAGVHTTGALAIGALSYLALRWTWATVGRVQYWVPRGTSGVYKTYCPGCHSRRHRVGGDWILTCHRCGWQPSRPVVRWLIHSVPAIQFRRSVSTAEAFIAGVGGSVLVFRPPTSVQQDVTVSPAVPSLPPLPGAENILLGLVAIVVGVVAVLWATRPRDTFCANCGQYLGKGGSENDACPKCGSNRTTHEDPGVGKKVKVKIKE